MFPYAFNTSSTNNIIVLFFLTFWQWFLSTHDVQIAKCHYIYRKGCRSLLGNVQTNSIHVFFSSGDWYKHCRSQTWGNLLQKSTTAALSCSEVCGVSLLCCVEVSSRHRHSTPLLSLSSTSSGKSAGEEHCTLLMEAKGTFSPRPAEMGRGRGGKKKGA